MPIVFQTTGSTVITSRIPVALSFFPRSIITISKTVMRAFIPAFTMVITSADVSGFRESDIKLIILPPIAIKRVTIRHTAAAIEVPR